MNPSFITFSFGKFSLRHLYYWWKWPYKQFQVLAIYVAADSRFSLYSCNHKLSNYIRALKKDNIVPSIKWKILRIVRGKPTSNYCRLCLTEKFFIINSIGDNRVLNKRSEFVNKCRHQNKYLLSYYGLS